MPQIIFDTNQKSQNIKKILLKKIHDSQIIHRDIRPPNIMLSMINDDKLCRSVDM